LRGGVAHDHLGHVQGNIAVQRPGTSHRIEQDPRVG
jgi:hypothetical protein